MSRDLRSDQANSASHRSTAGNRPCRPWVELPSGCWLRLLEEADAPELHAVVEANRDHLARWMPWAAGQTLGAALHKKRGQSVHAAGTLSLDQWNGAERVQMRLIDIAPAESGLTGS